MQVAPIPGGNEPDLGPERLSIAMRAVVLIGIIGPLLGVLLTPIAVWGWGFRWSDLVVALGLYTLSGLGITVGFHRLFVHRSFETTTPVKVVLGILGSMAFQGSLLEWSALHRRHHQHSDEPGDPHSPHGLEGGVFGLLRGFWHSHVGWIFDPGPIELDRYVSDLRRQPALRIVSELFPVWIVLGLLIPAALGGLLSGTWAGVLTGFIWGGPVRIFLVHHITWSVNSACHLWGKRPYRTSDESRDNLVFGLLAWGEGWHNTHHAFPTSARHGLRWWQIDISWWVIWTLSRLGLAWDVKIPTMQARLRRQNSA
jgi:stearoyl-CoA desaturase (delta-9 desaturase)